MTSILDAALYILKKYRSMTTMKLQKLTFYCQAEMLSRHGRPLFDEDFQAWRNGPVSMDLYRCHRGMFLIRDGELKLDGFTFVGNGSLNADEQKVVDEVCSELGSLSGNQLSQRTHAEAPWRDARGDLEQDKNSQNIISKQSMKAYYAKNPVISR